MNNNGRYDKNKLSEKINADELKEYLNYVIDTEVQKSVPEMNPDLIDECVDLLFEIEGREINIPKEKIERTVKSIIATHYRPKKRFYVFKIFAACVAIILGIQIIFIAAFHENLFKDVYDDTKYVISHFTQHDGHVRL